MNHSEIKHISHYHEHLKTMSATELAAHLFILTKEVADNQKADSYWKLDYADQFVHFMIDEETRNKVMTWFIKLSVDKAMVSFQKTLGVGVNV